jgi:hypothetical protein
MDNIEISIDILKNNGFINRTEDFCKPIMEREYYVKDWSFWEKWTNEEDGIDNCIKITFSKGITNNGALWHIHIDNGDCDTIGIADISYIWQFNMLMEIFMSSFKMNK